jgi:hypothetical protein
MILFIYIWSTLNIYWFIGIWLRCQQIQTNSYSVTFGYSQYLVQHSMNDPEGKNNYLPFEMLGILDTNDTCSRTSCMLESCRCMSFRISLKADAQRNSRLCSTLHSPLLNYTFLHFFFSLQLKQHRCLNNCSKSFRPSSQTYSPFDC